LRIWTMLKASGNPTYPKPFNTEAWTGKVGWVDLFDE